MGTHNICLYEEVDKNYTGCNLKTTELLECALIGACAVIRSNTVFDRFPAIAANIDNYCDFPFAFLNNEPFMIRHLPLGAYYFLVEWTTFQQGTKHV